MSSNRLSLILFVGLFSIPLTGSIAVVRAETDTTTNNNGTPQTNFRELASDGKHAELLQAYDEFVHQMGSDESLSRNDRTLVAQSAWALGLVDRARELWDAVLADKELSAVERARVSLARSILELQESRGEEARRIAQLAASTLDSSDLRAQLWLVVAEALTEQGAHSQAEAYYRKAVDESTGSARDEALYLLGKCQAELGLTKDARFTLVKIGRGGNYAPDALKLLIEMDFQQRDFDAVLTWLDEGKRDYTDRFQEPWVYYTEVSALVELGRTAQALETLAKFRNQHSDSEPWYLLAASAVSSQQVQQLIPRARLRTPERSDAKKDGSKKEGSE